MITEVEQTWYCTKNIKLYNKHNEDSRENNLFSLFIKKCLLFLVRSGVRQSYLQTAVFYISFKVFTTFYENLLILMVSRNYFSVGC